MVIKNKYILAHTTDISFKRFNPNQPFPQIRNNDNNNNNRNNNNANDNNPPAQQNNNVNDNMNLGANDFQVGGYKSGQNMMSQAISVRDNPNRYREV